MWANVKIDIEYSEHRWNQPKVDLLGWNTKIYHWFKLMNCQYIIEI